MKVRTLIGILKNFDPNKDVKIMLGSNKPATEGGSLDLRFNTIQSCKPYCLDIVVSNIRTGKSRQRSERNRLRKQAALDSELNR